MSKLSRLEEFDDALETFSDGVFTHEQCDALNDTFMRRYFESGCLCILSGKLALVAAQAPDAQAVSHYEAQCRCTRNYTEPVQAVCDQNAPGSDTELPF